MAAIGMSLQNVPAPVFLVLVTLALLPACIPACTDEPPPAAYAEPRPPERNPELAGRPAPFDLHAAYARDIHVSPGGDDRNGDGSQAAPFASLRRAAIQATPGTRILLAAGVYPPAGTLPDLQGKPQAPIAIVGEDGAVIDGGLCAEPNPGIHISNPRFVVLQDLEIRNTYPNGINIDDGGHYDTPAGPVVLRGLRIKGIGRGGNNDCLKLSGVDRFQVLDSEFSGCDRGEAIDMVGCHLGFISGNTFRDMPGTAVQTKGGSSDIVIHGNRFINVAARSVNLGGHTGAAYFRPPDAPFEAARIQVASNIFFRSGETAVAFAGCIDCLAAHNTVIEPQGQVVRLLEEHPERAVGRGGRFVNNLVVFNTEDVKGYVTAGRHARPETFVTGWNLWHAHDRKRFAGPRHGRGVPAERSAVAGVPPRFVAPAGGDYRLQADSPARGRGLDLPDMRLPDYDGRPFGSPPAVGAHGLP